MRESRLSGEADQAAYPLAGSPSWPSAVMAEPLESGARELRLIRGWVGELEELVPHAR